MTNHKRSTLSVAILESLLVTVGGEPRDTDTDRQPFYPELTDDNQDVDRPDSSDLDLRDPLAKVEEARRRRIAESGDNCDREASADVNLSSDEFEAALDLLSGTPVIDTSEEGAADEIRESLRRRAARRIRIAESDGCADDPAACNDLTASELAQIAIDGDDADLRDPLEIGAFTEALDNPYDDEDLTDDQIAALLTVDAIDIDDRDPLAEVTVNESFVANAVSGGLAAAGLGGMASSTGHHAANAASKVKGHASSVASKAKARVGKMSAATKKKISAGMKKAWKSGKKRLGFNESAENPYDCSDLSAEELASLIVDDSDLDERDPLDKVTEGRKVAGGVAGRMLEAFTHFAPDLIYTPEEDITTGRGENSIAVASKGHALHIDGRPSHDVNSYLAQSDDHDDFTRDVAMLARGGVEIGVEDPNDGYGDLHESLRRIRSMV